MTYYYINLRDGTQELLDEEGIDYESLDALRKAVLATARDLMCGDMVGGVLDFRFRIDAEDEDGVMPRTLFRTTGATSDQIRSSFPWLSA